MKKFKQVHVFGDGEESYFSEDKAPYWLKIGGPEGSTMCMRWFWEDHVLKLKVGDSVDTDFNTITRVG
jgi:hypothetical protein